MDNNDTHDVSVHAHACTNGNGSNGSNNVASLLASEFPHNLPEPSPPSKFYYSDNHKRYLELSEQAFIELGKALFRKHLEIMQQVDQALDGMGSLERVIKLRHVVGLPLEETYITITDQVWAE